MWLPISATQGTPKWTKQASPNQQHPFMTVWNSTAFIFFLCFDCGKSSLADFVLLSNFFKKLIKSDHNGP
jgi:hypothetical protein